MINNISFVSVTRRCLVIYQYTNYEAVVTPKYGETLKFVYIATTDLS